MPGSSAIPAAATSDPVLSAIGSAGLLGITSRQIATRTGLPVAELERKLGALRARQEVMRLGKGLWVLPRFSIPPKSGGGFRGPAWYDARFCGTFGVELAPYQGEIQFNPNEELAVHRWWPYVQGFSADFVGRTCERYGIGRGSTVLDPFAGSGTVTVEARLHGASTVGVELMPIAAFVCRAKHRWDVDPERLARGSERLIAAAGRGPLSPIPFLRETRRQFAPKVLESLLRLRREVLRLPPSPEADLLRLAFASILVGSSRMKRSPCLGYARGKVVDARAPVRLLRGVVERIGEDLRGLQARTDLGPPAEILEQNSRTLKLPPESVDLAVTSPPYVNGMDYVMNYKLEMAWLDQVASYPELAALKERMVACDNLAPAAVSAHRPGASVVEEAWLQDVLRGIRSQIRSKAIYRRTDMPEIVGKYFDDLVPVIGAVHRALRPGGRFVVVNGDSLIAGTYVPGDLLFARLAARVGFRVEGLEVARVRRSGQRRDFRLRETVLTLVKPRATG